MLRSVRDQVHPRVIQTKICEYRVLESSWKADTAGAARVPIVEGCLMKAVEADE